MKPETNVRKRIYTFVVALGLAVGSVGLAAAASGGAPATPDDNATEIQDPSYQGSVQAPAEDPSLTEAEEAAMLEGLATVTADDASAAASEAVAGDIVSVELDNENGSVVYSVEILDASGAEIDVKVDAGDGTVLDQQADDDSDSDDDAIEHENEHEGENDPDEGHED